MTNKRNFEIDFKLFKEIIHVIKSMAFSAENFSKYLEQKICKNSFCYVDIYEEPTSMFLRILTRYFDPDNIQEGIIPWWLYENVDKKIYEDDKVYDVNDIKDFFEYLKSEKEKLYPS